MRALGGAELSLLFDVLSRSAGSHSHSARLLFLAYGLGLLLWFPWQHAGCFALLPSATRFRWCRSVLVMLLAVIAVASFLLFLSLDSPHPACRFICWHLPRPDALVRLPCASMAK